MRYPLCQDTRSVFFRLNRIRESKREGLREVVGRYFPLPGNKRGRGKKKQCKSFETRIPRYFSECSSLLSGGTNFWVARRQFQILTGGTWGPWEDPGGTSTSND